MKLKMDLILNAMTRLIFHSLSVCFLCAFAFAEDGGAPVSLDISQGLSRFAPAEPSPARSVWKIQNDREDSGTAFAIGPDRFVTNFHVVFGMLFQNWSMRHVFLRREGESPLAVRRLIAVSPRCDLALLETAGHVSEWLKPATSPPSAEDSLSLWSCDTGQPEQILGVGGLRCDDHECFFPTDHIISKGTSGSPVLSPAGEVAAVASKAAGNLVYMEKTDCLKHFREGVVGLPCAGLPLDVCMGWSFQSLSSDDNYDRYILSNIMEMQGDFWAPREPAIAEGLYKRVFSFVQASARAGLPIAQVALALLYRNGRGVLKDDTKAAYWYREAANRNHPTAQFNLADMLYYAEGLSQDKEEAVLWYRRAARQGLSSAQFRLALMREDGEGVPKDLSKALDWYKEAGNHGHAGAQLTLMDIYYHGLIGAEQDKDQAFYWGLLAARQGRPGAQHNLGRLYEKGEGTEQNFSEAVHWYREAADQGLSHSQYRLALMAEEGRGMEQNIPLALIYYEEAALQGHERAKSRWDSLMEEER